MTDVAPSPVPPDYSNLRRVALSSAVSAAVGVAGGLIGLGGAELRLPYLAGVLRLPPHTAVRVNLAISLFTILAAIPARLLTLPDVEWRQFVPEVAGIVCGAVAVAYAGAGILHRVPAEQLRRAIFVLMLVLGVSLLAEAAIDLESDGFIPDSWVVSFTTGVAFGFVIGAVSSLLGVAGGEVIIPTLVFGYGVPIKASGTLSMIISLPTVSVGLVRHVRAGAFRERALLIAVVLPMGLASAGGAVGGALLAGSVSAGAVKVLLGALLIWSAWKVFGATEHR